MLSCIAQKKLTLARHELQEVVVLLSKLITQVGGILTSKADHLFDAFAITTIHFYVISTINTNRNN